MRRQYFLGIDLGSSSVKASLVDAETGKCAATTFYPEHEAPIIAVKSGWAEKQPEWIQMMPVTLPARAEYVCRNT